MSFLPHGQVTACELLPAPWAAASLTLFISDTQAAVQRTVAAPLQDAVYSRTCCSWLVARAMLSMVNTAGPKAGAGLRGAGRWLTVLG